MPLQTRVPAEVKRRFDAAADLRGISLSRYLEELIDLDPLAPPRDSRPLQQEGSIEQISA
ncbi:hypothetical protein Pth03_78220 [Planotetraspora thailandica]|uniref:Uncharacterized protein n=1 Tax=Planotetraspora thailandica TaxID=487172 RepID=A0A8J3Y210_9ACTN|nr:hypothetical protein Pth03_78220 [Planotetraspora thailandica]